MSKIKVLYIEDDADDFLIVSEIISAPSLHIENNFIIINAKTLDEGKKILRGGDVDVILLDLTLPDSISALETIKEVKKVCGAIPIIVVSGSLERDIYYKAIDLGIYEMVHKKYYTMNYLSASIVLAAKNYAG